MQSRSFQLDTFCTLRNYAHYYIFLYDIFLFLLNYSRSLLTLSRKQYIYTCCIDTCETFRVGCPQLHVTARHRAMYTFYTRKWMPMVAHRSNGGRNPSSNICKHTRCGEGGGGGGGGRSVRTLFVGSSHTWKTLLPPEPDGARNGANAPPFS